jgi:hypothetical protein
MTSLGLDGLQSIYLLQISVLPNPLFLVTDQNIPSLNHTMEQPCATAESNGKLVVELWDGLQDNRCMVKLNFRKKGCRTLHIICQNNFSSLNLFANLIKSLKFLFYHPAEFNIVAYSLLTLSLTSLT